MELDAMGMPVHILRDKVMTLLGSSGLRDTLRTFGIETTVAPRLSSAKPTETVQRFKIRLLTTAGEDLSTKVEFSRRGFDPGVRSEAIRAPFLAAYRLAPLVVPHYGAESAASQKVKALLGRRHTEARDILDLYILCSRLSTPALTHLFTGDEVILARDRVFSVDYDRYRDTVVAFLTTEDQRTYDSADVEGLLESGGAE